MKTVTIDGFNLPEADRAVLVDALQLYEAVCHGQIDQIGTVLCNEFAARRDVTAEFRERVARARVLFRQAHSTIHASDDFKARWHPAGTAVPLPGVRATQLLGRIQGEQTAVRNAEDDLRTQAEMADPHEGV